jgi:cysteine desulfuration protein SufE
MLPLSLSYDHRVIDGARGRALHCVPGDKVDAWRVLGCQSMVWLKPSGNREAMAFAATSDSAIVSGLIALVLRVYSGRPAAEILAIEPEFIERIGLSGHLSPTRKNGLSAMLAKIRDYARAALG